MYMRLRVCMYTTTIQVHLGKVTHIKCNTRFQNYTFTHLQTLQTIKISRLRSSLCIVQNNILQS